MTFIRLLAIFIGFMSLAVAFYQLRRMRGERVNVFLFLFTSLGLMVAGLFPEAIRYFSQLVFQGRITAPAIMSLLLVSVGVLWFLVLVLRGRTQRLSGQFDRYVREVAIADFMNREGGSDFDHAIVLVLIPALDEADNLPQVLDAIPVELDGRPIRALVIDDGSRDGTGEVARAHGALVVRTPCNRGGGAALRTGFTLCRRLGVEMAVTIDADGQHDPREIPVVLGPIIKGEADVVIGSRVRGSTDQSKGGVRYAGVRLFSKFISVLMGHRITDCSSGFRAFRVSLLDKVDMSQDQYHTAEMIIGALKSGLAFGEAPIHVRERMYGTSKKGKDLIYGLRFLASIIQSWLK